MVVMDRDDYNNKAEELLNQPAYRPIPSDPTSRLKTRLISLLKQIQTEGGMNEATYKRLYPTGGRIPQVLWATQGSQAGNTTKAHSFQHWGSNLPNIQGVIKNPQAPGGEIYTSYSQQTRLLGTPEGHQTSL